jgi:hypothetical protein
MALRNYFRRRIGRSQNGLGDLGWSDWAAAFGEAGGA